MTQVLIVGGGLAGLACARTLSHAGMDCLILEASDVVGGRARTDQHEGFLLDRGFQMLLTAYPEAKRFLDYRALGLRRFVPGALVRAGNSFHRLADPLREPGDLLTTALSPLATLSDKLAIVQLWLRSGHSPAVQEFRQPETTTLDFLVQRGFSPGFIDSFLRPFFGGIFLERELRTSSRMFEFVFQMFAQGYAALPWQGMGAMAKQLASRLPVDCVRLKVRVQKVVPKGVVLESGETLRADAVVLATDPRNAARLLDQTHPESSRATACLYFAAPKPPIKDPILVLNGTDDGPVNHLCVPSVVSPSYAPSGSHLISANVVGSQGSQDASLAERVLLQMRKWFGRQVDSWRHLRTYYLPDALPEQSPATGGVSHREVRLSGNLYVCGDHRDSASINGALASGRRAAEAVMNDRIP